MARLELQGRNADEKLAHVSLILERMSRKTQKVATTIVPPSPIYGFKDLLCADGIIFKCLIPAKGNISRLCLAIEEIDTKDPVSFEILFEKFGDGKVKQSYGFSTKKRILIEDVNLNVDPGDCITLKTADPERLSGIYATILYNIDIAVGTKAEIAIQQFEALEV